MNHSHLLGAMQIFISVVDSGSFSESARRLGLSQPSVSRQINALEEHLGIRLLQRSTRQLSLTEAGKIYYEKARHIQYQVTEAYESIRGFKEKPSGQLKISAPYTWAEHLITPHLNDFLIQYPEIKLDIECNDDVQDIIEDQLDLVIRVGKLEDSSHIAIPLAKIRMVLCATPAYTKKYGLPKTPPDLQNHNFIMYQDYNRLIIKGSFGHQKITIKGSVCTNMVSVILSAIQQNIGLSVIPDLLIKPLLESGELIDLMPNAEISIESLPITGVYALYSSRKQLPAKVRAFLDYFRSNTFNR